MYCTCGNPICASPSSSLSPSPSPSPFVFTFHLPSWLSLIYAFYFTSFFFFIPRYVWRKNAWRVRLYNLFRDHGGAGWISGKRSLFLFLFSYIWGIDMHPYMCTYHCTYGTWRRAGMKMLKRPYFIQSFNELDRYPRKKKLNSIKPTNPKLNQTNPSSLYYM